MKIAIIPARIGSKRIKEKNIKSFCGKPIIYWIIKKIIKANIFDKIIVSTDSNKIAKIAKQCGAEVPFLRPKKISDDYTGTSEVIRHGINFLKNKEIYPTYVCCIYPTAAFLLSKDIKKGLQVLKKKKVEYVFSATSLTSSLYRSFYFNNHKLNMMFKKNYKSRTQDFKKLYIDIGQFYWAKTTTWMTKNKIFSSKSKIVVIPNYRSYDIDNLEDWVTAEKVFKSNEKKR